jgi:NAD(P)-dependent dehydrogenase (short-subunit alcohol dehydrogenase family)
MTNSISVSPDRHALIVGASRGIGLALVRALLADPRYAAVTLAARDPDTAAVDELIATQPQRLSKLRLDVSDETSIAAVATELAACSPRLHLLIDCAGVLHGDGLKPERRLADVDPAAVMRSFAVNALGPLLLAKHLHPLLTHDQPAVLANLSARVGSIGDNRLGGWYAYRAAKAAQNQITRTVSVELARRAPNLVCVSLHPGTVDTGLSKPFQGGVESTKLFTPDDAARKLLSVIGGLRREDSGRFFAWDGSEIPW